MVWTLLKHTFPPIEIINKNFICNQVVIDRHFSMFVEQRRRPFSFGGGLLSTKNAKKGPKKAQKPSNLLCVKTQEVLYRPLTSLLSLYDLNLGLWAFRRCL